VSKDWKISIAEATWHMFDNLELVDPYIYNIRFNHYPNF